MGRINFGVLTLVSKVKGATNIKQFRPIAVLNVILRTVTKVLANRLAPVANEVIHPCQTWFIRGRYILEGIVVIHEVLHEVKVKKIPAIMLKLDSRKHMTGLTGSF